MHPSIHEQGEKRGYWNGKELALVEKAHEKRGSTKKRNNAKAVIYHLKLDVMKKKTNEGGIT